jgi:2-(3-amino-3-carboxypropyl)histidine synthase
LKTRIFDLEEEKLKQEVKKRHAKSVLIQLPDGLKPEGPRLADIVQRAGAAAIVAADPCYGACDLAADEAQSLGADMIVHLGHTPASRRKAGGTLIIYVEAKARINVKPAVEKALHLLTPWKRIGLLTTVQHVKMLGEIKERLLKAGKIVALGDAGSLKYAGQVVGCDYSNACTVAEEVEAFLFVGGGRFHALGAALATSKPTVVADPYEHRAYSVDDEARKIRSQRWISIRDAMKSERFGILIGLKSGQKRIKKALQVRDKLEDAGKKTTLLAIHEITPECLVQFPTLEAYVNTACPRISIDDASRYQKPVLTINEAMVVTGELAWEQLLKEGWFAG